jgi:hypothetical protein
MHDPRTTRRLALAVSATLLVVLACTCTNPLTRLRGQVPGAGGIGGRVWFDTNGNGLQDEGERRLPDIEVRLVDEAGNQLESTKTDANGEYHLAQAEAGSYVIWFIPPNGLAFTLNDVGSDDTIDSDAIVASGQTEAFSYDGLSKTSLDAGMVLIDSEPTPASGSTPAVEATQPVETDAAPTEELAGDTPQVHFTYIHHSGYSEIVITFSNLVEGQEISGKVLGSGVSGDGEFTAVGGADGTCEIRVRITSYGVYDVDIPELGISQPVTVVAATATPY